MSRSVIVCRYVSPTSSREFAQDFAGFQSTAARIPWVRSPSPEEKFHRRVQSIGHLEQPPAADAGAILLYLPEEAFGNTRKVCQSL